MMDFLAAYALSLAIEAPILYLILYRKYPAGLIARNSVIATSLTLPFVWFVFPESGLEWILATALAELFAFAAEACIYGVLFTRIRTPEAILASFICNAASFLAGLAII